MDSLLTISFLDPRVNANNPFSLLHQELSDSAVFIGPHANLDYCFQVIIQKFNPVQTHHRPVLFNIEDLGFEFSVTGAPLVRVPPISKLSESDDPHLIRRYLY